MIGKQLQLDGLIRPVVEALDYQLWGIEFKLHSQNSILRIFIDTLDKKKHINLEDCEIVSHQVSGILDVANHITEQYTLEVSSPGINRYLFTLDQYVTWSGTEVNIRLLIPFAGNQKYSGIVKGIKDKSVVLIVDEHELLLPIENIEKAQIIPRFN